MNDYAKELIRRSFRVAGAVWPTKAFFPTNRDASATAPEASRHGIEYRKLKTFEPSARAMPRFFEADFDNSEFIRRIEEETLTFPARDAGLVIVNDAKLQMPSCALATKDGYVPFEARVTLYDAPSACMAYFNARLKAGSPIEQGILLPLVGLGNYYHFLADMLPRAQLLDLAPEYDELPILAPRNSPKFVREALDTVFGSRMKWLEDGVYKVGKLVVPSRVNDLDHTPGFAIDWMRQKFWKEATTPRKRIYISRKDSTRKVSNEDEVVSVLKPYGFESYSLSGKSFIEQVSLFESADAVVASHGAGLTNIMFMKPGSTVLELFGARFSDMHKEPYYCTTYWSMATLAGLNYGFQLDPSQDSNLVVDLNRLEQLAKQALG